MARRNRVKLEKNSFVAGELTPLLNGRTDLAQYGQGTRRAENVVIEPHGGVSGRPGFRYVNSVKFPTKRTRLIPFQVSTEAAYIVEAGDLYFRFYVNDGILLDGGMSEVEVVTPWDQNEVFRLQWAQEANVMYIVHPDFPPYKLSRTSVTEFSLEEVEWNSGRAPLGPFNLDPDNKISANVGGTTYDRRLTLDKDTFTADDVGRVLYARKSEAVKAAFWEIKQFISATVVEVDNLFVEGAADFTATHRWAFGLFDDANGCNAVTFHQGRLAFGGFKRQVDYMAWSVTDDFENFEIESADPDLTDADNADKAITRRTVSNQVNAIRWMRSVEGIQIIGTSGGEFQASSGSDDSLTPSATVIRQVTSRGSTEVPGYVVDNRVFFVERSNTVIRRFGYASSGSSNSLTSANFSILSSHLLKNGGGANAMEYTQTPTSQLWIPMQNGQLVSWSYEAEQEVSGPARQIMGGRFLGQEPPVESVAVSQSAVPIFSRSVQEGFSGPATSEITNPGAEAAAMTGWLTDGGNWNSVTSYSTIPGPYDGSYFFARIAADTTENKMYQTVDLTTFTGFNNTLVDNGNTTVDISAQIASSGANKDLRFTVTALDVDSNVLATILGDPDDGYERLAAVNTWTERGVTGAQLPPATRKLQITFASRKGGGTFSSGAAMDDVQLSVYQETVTPETTYDGNEDRLWVVVKRTIDGQTTRYVEYLESPWRVALPASATEIERVNRLDHFFGVDSGLTYDVPILVTGVSKANPSIVTAPAHGFSNDDLITFRNLKGLDGGVPTLHLIDHETYQVQSATTDTFALHHRTTGDPIDGADFLTFLATEDAYTYALVDGFDGLDHLEGQEVVILADGAPQPNTTVSGGSITLAVPASVVHVGLYYEPYVTTMSAYFPGPWGSDAGVNVGIAEVTLDLVDTIGLDFGRGDTPAVWESIPWTPYQYGRMAPPFTGFKTVAVGDDAEALPAISFRQTQPLPFTVNALYLDYESTPL